jgi:hypothetical protein
MVLMIFERISVEKWWIYTDRGKQKYTEKNLAQ